VRPRGPVRPPRRVRAPPACPSSLSTAPASIILIHWNAAEARERVTRLRAMGLDVGAWDTSGQQLLRELRARAPAVILIDLTRLPAHRPTPGALLAA
jgi:hypothetical protein